MDPCLQCQWIGPSFRLDPSSWIWDRGLPCAETLLLASGRTSWAWRATRHLKSYGFLEEVLKRCLWSFGLSLLDHRLFLFLVLNDLFNCALANFLICLVFTNLYVVFVGTIIISKDVCGLTLVVISHLILWGLVLKQATGLRSSSKSALALTRQLFIQLIYFVKICKQIILCIFQHSLLVILDGFSLVFLQRHLFIYSKLFH